MEKKYPAAGVVGTGFIGPVHVEALRRIGVPVFGLVSSSLERAKKVSETLGIPRAYASIEELAADPEIDVIHITSPNYLHGKQMKAAFALGKNVLCEKPLTLTSEESREILEASRSSKGIGCICYNLRYYPMVQLARERVRGGEIGEILLAHGSYLQDWLLYPTDWNWRVEPEKGGALRVVGDIGTHWMDMIQFITGLKIEELVADRMIAYPKRLKPKTGVSAFQSPGEVGREEVSVQNEDYASILLRFSSGARGSLDVSQISAGRKNRLWFEIDGTKGSLSWDSEHPNELWEGKRSEANRVLLKDPSLLPESIRWTSSYPGGHQEGYADTFKNLFRDFYNYLSSDRRQGLPPSLPSLEDGYQEMLLLDAVEQSIRENRWARVE